MTCQDFFRKFVYVVFILITLETVAGQENAEDENVQLSGLIQFEDEQQNTTSNWIKPMRPVVPDELVNYQFHMNITGAKSVHSIEFVIKGISMEFTTDDLNDIFKVKFFDEYDNETESFTPMFVEDNNNALRAVFSTNGHQISRAYGTYYLMVKDQLSDRLTVSHNIKILARSESGVELNSTTLNSDGLMLHVPEMVVSAADPSNVNMNEMSTTNLQLLLPKYRMGNSYIKLVLPFHEEHLEAKMTFKRFMVTSTTGFDKKTASQLADQKEDAISRTKTSERSEAILEFTNITVQEHAAIFLEAKTILQDHHGYGRGKRLGIGFGFKVNTDAIWVGRSTIRIRDPIDPKQRRPVLTMRFTQFKNYHIRKLTVTRFRINLSHAESSSGSAYNITANIYCPPYITIQRPLAMFDAVRPVEIDIKDQNIQLQFDRISIPMNTRYLFNVSINTTDEQFLQAQYFDIVYEVIYNGWRNDTELSQPLEIYNLVIDKHNILRKRYHNKELSCACPFDENNTTCACCLLGGCPCGDDDPYKCVNCSNMWSCMATLPGYYDKSSLIDEAGNIYSCSGRENMRPAQPYVSCYKDEYGNITALSPMIGTILGMEKRSRTLYGISNTGFGYVVSDNDGQSWRSIPDYTFMRASRNITYVKAIVR